MPGTNTKVTIECTPEQAQAIADSLEVFTRLSIGQIEHLAEMITFGAIPLGGRHDNHGRILERTVADYEKNAMIRDLCNQIKTQLGYPLSGSNSIGHPHVTKEAHRAWEAKKVIDKALAEYRNPKPEFAGVNYDGLTVRYTSDPAPIAHVVRQKN